MKNNFIILYILLYLYFPALTDIPFQVYFTLSPSTTDQIHNLQSYVRDFYFFKRAQYPQLLMVHMEPEAAYNALQRQAFTLKLLEIGKVLMAWSILKRSDQVGFYSIFFWSAPYVVFFLSLSLLSFFLHLLSVCYFLILGCTESLFPP